MNRPQRILIVNPFGIGDVLFSTPLIRALRRAFPEARLAYLCNRRTEEILRRNPHIDQYFIYEKDELLAQWRRNRVEGLTALLSLLWHIKRQRFDAAIDLSLGERYGFFLALLRLPRRIGFDFRHRGRFLTHRFAMDGYDHQHVVEYYGQLLAMIGIQLRERDLELVPTEEDRRLARERLAGLVPSSTRALIGVIPAGGVSWGLQANFRRWSPTGFIEVGRALSQRHGATILIFGEPKDQEECAHIAQAIGPSAVDLSGHTTLGQFVSLIGRCHLVISNDGGPIHIAASQSVPTVSIFGPVDPDVYGPYPPGPRHRIVSRLDLPCRPCYHRFKLPPCPYERACLTTLEAEDVLAVCEEALQQAVVG